MLLIWIIGSVLSGLIGFAIGSDKGQGGVGFVLGMLLGPLGWIIAAVMSPAPHHIAAQLRRPREQTLSDKPPPYLEPRLTHETKKRNHRMGGPSTAAPDEEHWRWRHERRVEKWQRAREQAGLTEAPPPYRRPALTNAQKGQNFRNGGPPVRAANEVHWRWMHQRQVRKWKRAREQAGLTAEPPEYREPPLDRHRKGGNHRRGGPHAAASDQAHWKWMHEQRVRRWEDARAERMQLTESTMTTEKRLAEVERLHTNGTISDEERKNARAAILAG